MAGESPGDDGAAAGDHEPESGGQAVAAQPQQRLGRCSVVDVVEGALDGVPPVEEEDDLSAGVWCSAPRTGPLIRRTDQWVTPSIPTRGACHFVGEAPDDSRGQGRVGGARDRPHVGEGREVPKCAGGALDDVEVKVRGGPLLGQAQGEGPQQCGSSGPSAPGDREIAVGEGVPRARHLRLGLWLVDETDCDCSGRSGGREGVSLQPLGTGRGARGTVER